MAHYKRGKCRYNGKCRHASLTFYRKRWGLKPIIVPRFERPPGSKRWEKVWKEAWLSHRDMVRRAWPDEFSMMSNYPRSWDIQFHTRPRRAKEKLVERKIVTGKIDPDEAIFPLSKKPHIYYW